MPSKIPGAISLLHPPPRDQPREATPKRLAMATVVKRLEGMVAVITGGASGIGASTARLFRRHGAKVVIADIDDELGRSVCAELGPDDAVFIHCDVTDEDHVSRAVDLAVEKYGKLDIMVNNAGTAGTPTRSILNAAKADMERVLAVNVVGPFLGTKHAARVMIPNRRGTIITTASMAASVCSGGSHDYICSKHGAVGLTKSSAAELGKYGIRVNCVSPAALATRLTTRSLGISKEAVERNMRGIANLKGVTLEAEDVADAVLYLASEDSRYVSGHDLVVDGGFSIVNPSMSQLANRD